MKSDRESCLLARSDELCRTQLTMMEGWYRPTEVATLLERVVELHVQLGREAGPSAESEPPRKSSQPPT